MYLGSADLEFLLNIPNVQSHSVNVLFCLAFFQLQIIDQVATCIYPAQQFYVNEVFQFVISQEDCSST